MSQFASLQQKYGDFAVPAYKIVSAGTELSKSEYILDHIVVDNGMGKTAGACRFSLYQVYEHGSRQFSGSALNKLTPGNQISVSLGYGSSVSEVFTGYIDELKMQYDRDTICLSAGCMDARALMRDGAAYSALKEKSTEDAVSAILDRYSPLISSRDITISTLEKNVYPTQTGSDLDYVQDAADKRGMYFYLECGKAFIAEAIDTICVEFDWTQFDMEFSMRYLERKICGLGYDYAAMEPFSVEKEAKAKKQTSLLTVTQTVPLPPHSLGDAGTAVITALANTAKRETVSGTITCRGIPEPKLGQKLKINKFPLASFGAGDSFTVLSVRHRLDSDNGYLTEIGIGG